MRLKEAGRFHAAKGAEVGCRSNDGDAVMQNSR